jgi:hypothetical protein
MEEKLRNCVIVAAARPTTMQFLFFPSALLFPTRLLRHLRGADDDVCARARHTFHCMKAATALSLPLISLSVRGFCFLNTRRRSFPFVFSPLMLDASSPTHGGMPLPQAPFPRCPFLLLLIFFFFFFFFRLPFFLSPSPFSPLLPSQRSDGSGGTYTLARAVP